MKSKEDDAIIEVWEMKEKVHLDFYNSKFKSFIEFIENDVKDIKQQFHIKYRNKIENQLTTS